VALDGLLIASVLVSEPYVLSLWFMAAMALALSRPGRIRLPVFAGAADDHSSGQVVPRS
jgi:hypothetical protein